ncbi:polymer-forming cytoskeletal protein [Undibacterium arcticum]|uniref:Polymer-forming cytoskeletal protein n=1 Tax=Undibacterium arcticum TaxID=1762892 RepID=A0ABV7F553_9BURK
MNPTLAGIAPNPSLVVDFDAERITTILGAKSFQQGDIKTGEGVLVLGEVDGDVQTDVGSSMVGAGGIVRGVVSGNRVIIAGTVMGDVFAMDTLILTETAVINGNVHYKNIAMKSEATINGRLIKIRD